MWREKELAKRNGSSSCGKCTYVGLRTNGPVDSLGGGSTRWLRGIGGSCRVGLVKTLGEPYMVAVVLGYAIWRTLGHIPATGIYLSCVALGFDIFSHVWGDVGRSSCLYLMSSSANIRSQTAFDPSHYLFLILNSLQYAVVFHATWWWNILGLAAADVSLLIAALVGWRRLERTPLILLPVDAVTDSINSVNIYILPILLPTECW